MQFLPNIILSCLRYFGVCEYLLFTIYIWLHDSFGFGGSDRVNIPIFTNYTYRVDIIHVSIYTYI